MPAGSHGKMVTPLGTNQVEGINLGINLYMIRDSSSWWNIQELSELYYELQKVLFEDVYDDTPDDDPGFDPMFLL